MRQFHRAARPAPLAQGQATRRLSSPLHRLLVFGLISLLAAPLAEAAALEELRPLKGRRAVVELRDGRRVRGALEGVEPGTLTVDGQRLSCAEVASVKVRGKSKRGLGMALGAGAGLAAGLLLGARLSNEGADQAAALAAAGLAGAGAGIGFFAGQPKSQVVTVDSASCP